MSITKQFLKLLFVSTLIVIYSYAVSANNHRPIISVFSIKTPKLNLKFSEIMKNSVLHSLSEKNFLTQDGNKTYRYFDNNNFVRIDEVISNNPKMVQEYLAGKDKLLGFFVGQAMKKTKGQANPKILNEILNEKLNKKD